MSMEKHFLKITAKGHKPTKKLGFKNKVIKFFSLKTYLYTNRVMI